MPPRASSFVTPGTELCAGSGARLRAAGRGVGPAAELVFFDLLQLLDPADVPGVAELGAEEDLDDLPDLLLAEQIGAEAQDVAVVVLARPAGGHLLVDQRRADAADFIG